MNKRNIYIMYAIALLQGMVFYGPIATLYREAYGVGIFEITLIEGISLALCVALEVPWGAVADRIGYRKTMLFCCALYFVSKIVFYRADGFWTFLAERLMLSVVIAGLSGVDTSILYISCGGNDSSRVFGVYNALGTAGLIAASAVYSLFIGENYRLAALLTVVSYGIAALLAFVLKETKTDAGPRKSGAREIISMLSGLFRDRRTLAFILSAALLRETNQTLTVFVSQLQYVRCGMPDRAMGLAYIAVTVAGLLGCFSFAFCRRLGNKKGGLTLFAVCALSCLLLAFTKSAVLSVVCIILVRVSSSLFEPLQNELQNRLVKTADRASELSVNALIMDGAGITTNLVYGGASEFSLTLAFSIGAALSAAGAILFFIGCGKKADAARFIS